MKCGDAPGRTAAKLTADRGHASGVVVVPREHLDTVIAVTRTIEQREAAWRQAVAEGVSIAAVTGADAVIDERANSAAIPLP